MSDLQVIRGNHRALRWSGAIEVEHVEGWSRAWRLPLHQRQLFPGDKLWEMASIPTGVRIELATTSSIVQGAVIPERESDELQVVDLIIDDVYFGSVSVSSDGMFFFDGLPRGLKHVELWLPQRGHFRLTELGVERGSTMQQTARRVRPRLITYGSSITQCRSVSAPTRTWPSIVARSTGMDLTCLGFAGQCHLDPAIARLIRDLPADIIVAELGINVHGAGTFSARSFGPAVLGFLRAVRDGHPDAPVIVVSPLFSPSREATAGSSGMTLEEIRRIVGDAVLTLREVGDERIWHVDGRSLIGSAERHLLHDGLHPSEVGYLHIADAIGTVIRGILPRPQVQRTTA